MYSKKKNVNRNEIKSATKKMNPKIQVTNRNKASIRRKKTLTTLLNSIRF